MYWTVDCTFMLAMDGGRRRAGFDYTKGYFEKFKFGYRVGFSLSGKEQKMVHMGSYSAVFCDAARE